MRQRDRHRTHPAAPEAAPTLDQAIAAAMREKAEAEALHKRRVDRYNELSGKRYRNPALKARFLRRLDGEIRAARERLDIAEANLEGLLLARDAETGGGTA